MTEETKELGIAKLSDTEYKRITEIAQARQKMILGDCDCSGGVALSGGGRCTCPSGAVS